MNDGFIFYQSFLQAVDAIPDEAIQLEAYRAICNYGIKGETPPDDVNFITKALFSVIKPQIDANNKRRAAGKKGGQSTPKEQHKRTSQNSASTLAKENKHPSQDSASTLAEDDKHTCTKKEAKEKVKGKEKVKDKAKEKAKDQCKVKDTHKEKAQASSARKHSSHDRYETVVNHWNEMARVFHLPTATPITKNTDIRARNLDLLNHMYTITDILTTMDSIASSDFLQGKSPSGWTVSLDWFLDPDHFRQIREGHFESKAKKDAKAQAEENAKRLAEKLRYKPKAVNYA